MERVPHSRYVIANFVPRFEAALQYYITKRSVVGKPQSLIAAIAFLAVSLGAVGLTVEAQSPEVAPTPSDQSSETKIPVPEDLQKILSAGTVPKTLAQLRLLEQQFGQISAAAKLCTVSIKIGQAQGCGVIIDGGGKVLTAAHVAMRPNKPATVILANGRRLKAMTLGLNKNVDAGMLQISPGQNEGAEWPHATLATVQTCPRYVVHCDRPSQWIRSGKRRCHTRWADRSSQPIGVAD